MIRLVLASAVLAVSAFTFNASAACVNGERQYSPVTDDHKTPGASNFEYCVDGRWTRKGDGPYISNPRAVACVDGERKYSPVSDDTKKPGGSRAWETCVAGKWTRAGEGAYISNPTKVACEDGDVVYNPAYSSDDGFSGVKFFQCVNGAYQAAN